MVAQAQKCVTSHAAVLSDKQAAAGLTGMLGVEMAEQRAGALDMLERSHWIRSTPATRANLSSLRKANAVQRARTHSCKCRAGSLCDVIPCSPPSEVVGSLAWPHESFSRPVHPLSRTNIPPLTPVGCATRYRNNSERDIGTTDYTDALARIASITDGDLKAT